MHYFLPFIVAGIATGSVYGLAGTGLVLTYKTSGIFNFAHGSVATIAAFVFYWLHTQHGWPWPLVALLTVLVLGPAIGVVFELMARQLADAGHVLKIASTVGVVVGVLAVADIWYGSSSASFPHYLPTSTVDVLGTHISWEQIILMAVALVACAALYVFFRVTRLGTQMRAVVDDAALLSMTGRSATSVRRWSWVIGASFAALSGILLAPSLSLSGLLLTQLVVQAFGAAAIGMFSSLPLTYLGGLIIGVAGSLATKYTAQVPSLAGLPPGLPFIVLFLVLVLTPRSKLTGHRFVPTVHLAMPYVAPARVRVLAGVVAIIVLCLVPQWVGPKLGVYSAALADVILFLSLGLLVKVSGQVSLCQYGFAAVGAAAMGHYVGGGGMPWLVGLVLAGLTAVPIGALIAIPAIRLSGVFLALATLGFGLLLEQLFYQMDFMFGSTASGLAVPRPEITVFGLDLSSDRGMYYVVLAAAVLAALAAVLIMRSRLGRLLGALADSPVALETLGVTTSVSRVLVFSVCSFLAAISGALTASLLYFGVGSEFASFNSLTLVALVVIVPLGAPWYALVAAAGLDILPAYLDVHNITDYLGIIFGVSAALAPITLARHPGVPRRIRRVIDEVDARIPRLRVPRLRVPRAAPPALSLPVPVASRGGPGLEVADLTVAYGGVVAVDGAHLVAPPGQITGLVGPNGAGKTTTFNAVCGLVRPRSGAVELHGRNVSRLGPAGRARRGLGRTFQRVELFDSMTVRENLAMGGEGALAGANPLTQLASFGRRAAVLRAAVDEAAELAGITELLDRPIERLSTGQRRLVELARVLAGSFDMILLDEPSSGLDRAETARFGEVLRQVVAKRRVGVLIVEHDMALIRQICDHVWVLDFGKLIFDGTPQQMLDSDLVQSAYLGREFAV